MIMIKNVKQLGIAKNKLIEMQEALKLAINNKEEKDTFKNKMAQSALENLIKEINLDVLDYTTLCNNDLNVIKTTSIEDLPHLLVKARLAKKMSQKDLATIIGIDEQQIQRYEATDYESASWTRIVEIILALNLNIKMEKITVGKLSFTELFTHSEDITNESIIKAEQKIRTTSLLNI
jgi:transcriptional regulator with XRE-family HTH domain